MERAGGQRAVTTSKKHQRVYEQLGAPVLLYRDSELYYSQSLYDIAETTSPAAAGAYRDSRERLSRAQARWYYHQLIPSAADVDDDSPPFPPKQHHTRSRKCALQQQGIYPNHATQIVDAFKKYDESLYVPAERAKLSGSSRKTRTKSLGIQDDVRQLSVLYDRERRNRGHPDYMAPLETDCIHPCLANETKVYDVKQKRRQKLVFDRDHPNGPSRYGNCLSCFSCPCHACRASLNHSTCLLHPVGTLLDHIRLSFLSLPRGRPVMEATVDDDDSNPMMMKDLDAGDTVRQLQECGDLIFVARTDIHCTVFSVEVMKPPNEKGAVEQCWGWGIITRLHRIDLRSLSRAVPSYRPFDLACHPKYGRSFTKPNIVILSGEVSGNVLEKNNVHHVQCGQSFIATKHTFRNIHEISEIDFTSPHPMVLWAAARSHVRPALSVNEIIKRPRIGFGTSLFTLDLRSDQATFQWSPSKEDFLTEGAYGISGIYTDWRKAHSVWVSSTSAGKSWELDSRMPPRPVTAWSLSHACDEPGVVFPSTGLYGAGTLFSQPYIGHASEPGLLQSPAILSVNKNPGAFGLHLFQRPETGPRFQSNSIECVASPALASLENASIAVTSTFVLPDISDSVFPCGLCSFRAPPSSLLSIPDLVRLGFIEEEVTGVVCAVTMTNKGDVYVHSLLETKASHLASRPFPGLPVGATMIPVPPIQQSPISDGSETTLQISLTNNYPVSSSAFVPPALDFGSDPPVLHLPSQEIYLTADDTDEHEDEMLVSLASTPTLPRIFGEHTRAGTVAVQTGLYTAAAEHIRESHEYFESALQPCTDLEAKQLRRSDLTSDLIQRASETWKAQDD